MPILGFLIEPANFHYFSIFKLFSIFNDNRTELVSDSQLNQLVRTYF